MLTNEKLSEMGDESMTPGAGSGAGRPDGVDSQGGYGYRYREVFEKNWAGLVHGNPIMAPMFHAAGEFMRALETSLRMSASEVESLRERAASLETRLAEAEARARVAEEDADRLWAWLSTCEAAKTQGFGELAMRRIDAVSQRPAAAGKGEP
jgi:hypothetical protein